MEGKVAIVTGGANGLGRATCKMLAREGARVAVVDVDDERAQSVVEEIQRDGGEAKFWHLDVTDGPAVEEVVGEVARRFGKIDVLVNNAAVAGPQKPTHEVEEREYDEVFAVNTKGVFLCTKHVIPHLRLNGGGSIVNISSVNGVTGSADIPIYHATKGAVRLMAKTDGVVYARENIRVNAIHPGSIRTPLSEALAHDDPGGPAAYREMLARLHPIGHQGEPEDVAYGVLYLASDESKFVTGSELVIDGGYTAQ